MRCANCPHSVTQKRFGADCPFESRRRMYILQVSIKGEMRQLSTFRNAEKMQADCPFESRRRMYILRVSIKGEMRRIFFALFYYITISIDIQVQIKGLTIKVSPKIRQIKLFSVGFCFLGSFFVSDILFDIDGNNLIGRLFLDYGSRSFLCLFLLFGSD